MVTVPISRFSFFRYYALLLRIRRRIAGLRSQLSMHLKNGGIVIGRCEYDFSALGRLELRLVNYSLICSEYKELLFSFNRFPKTLESHSIDLFGVYYPLVGSYDSITSNILKVMKDRCKESRRQELMFRFRVAIEEAVRSGWFVVFNTLTVRPSEEALVFCSGSTAWTDYVRTVARCSPLGHKYFCVVERGASTGRLHIHVVHLLRSLPIGSSDPNYGSSLCRREISAFKRLWKFGFSSPIAVRFNHHDAFGSIGWRWPMLSGTTLPVLNSVPGQLASYLGSYLGKGNILEKGGYIWRTRMSRSLGLETLRKVVQGESLESLESMLLLIPRRSERLKVMEVLVPWHLIVREVSRQWFLKKLKRNPEMMWGWLRTLKPSQDLVSRLRSLRRLKGTSNLLSTGCIRMPSLRTSGIFNSMQSSLDSFFGGVVIGRRVSGPVGPC